MNIYQDSVDIEIRIIEGPQATIDRVTIKGNDRTNEHVVRRKSGPDRAKSLADQILSGHKEL